MRRSIKSKLPEGCKKISQLFSVFLICAFSIWLFGVAIQTIVCNEQTAHLDNDHIIVSPTSTPVSVPTISSYSIPVEVIDSELSQPQESSIIIIVHDSEIPNDSISLSEDVNDISERDLEQFGNKLQERQLLQMVSQSEAGLQASTNTSLLENEYQKPGEIIVHQQQCVIWGYQITHPLRVNPVQVALGLVCFIVVVSVIFLAMFLRKCSKHKRSTQVTRLTKGDNGRYTLGDDSENLFGRDIDDIEAGFVSIGTPLDVFSNESKDK